MNSDRNRGEPKTVSPNIRELLQPSGFFVDIVSVKGSKKQCEDCTPEDLPEKHKQYCMIRNPFTGTAAC